jgi:hypothetical protein
MDARSSQKRTYYKANREDIRAREETYRTTERGRAVDLLAKAHYRAAKQGLPFDLTLEWVEGELKAALTDGCPYLGIPVYFGKGKHDPHSPTIDQFIPGAGYIQVNCIIVSHKANSMKNDAPPEFVKRLGDNVDHLSRTRFKGAA